MPEIAKLFNYTFSPKTHTQDCTLSLNSPSLREWEVLLCYEDNDIWSLGEHWLVEKDAFEGKELNQTECTVSDDVT